MRLSAYAVTLSLAVFVCARPQRLRRADFTLQNGQDAIALNQQFATLDPNSPCNASETACVQNQFAQCVNGNFVLQPCGGGLVCAALPLVNSPGTSITCTTAADRDARIAANGATGATGASGVKVAPALGAASPAVATGDAATARAAVRSTAGASAASGSTVSGNNAGAHGAASQNGEDPQSSLTLLKSVIAKGFENDGQKRPIRGQVPSATSSNNYINFCEGHNITNGLQNPDGSCNPAPMGVIASSRNMPSCKFVFPPNGGTVKANTNFTIKLAIKHLNTGFFVNPNTNYFSAPQTVDENGDITGHSHVVIDPIPALNSTTPTDPKNDFVFFKGLNEKAVNGILSVVVPGGLPAGFYRLSTINSAANHQPALVSVAQHGSLDDTVYFTAA